jgi:hypothetical protein
VDSERNLPAQPWSLLIYTVPSAPTSKRAAIWREIKRLGALYLRDGVCVLPDTSTARAKFEALAGRVQKFGGQATVVFGAELSPVTAEALSAELTRLRQAEYEELVQAATGLQQHIQKEATHRAFDRAACTSIVGDLGRLHRWLDQVVARDYRQEGNRASILAVLATCSAELEMFTAAIARGVK